MPLLFVYKGQTTELLSQRWLNGLVEHNQHIYLSWLHISLRSNIITHNPSQFRSTYIKPSHFLPPNNKKTIPIPKLKSISISQTEIKSISTTQTKIKSISMLNQAICGPHLKTESTSTTTTHTKTNSIDRKLTSARTQSISILRKKNKTLSIPTLIRCLRKKSC